MNQLALATGVAMLSIGASLGAADPAKPAPGKSDPAQPPQTMPLEPALKMDRFVVDSDSTMSFGISLKIQRYTLTNKIVAMYIDEVEKESDAEAKGLEAGMGIVAIDGRPVTDIDGTFRPGSDLRRIFIGRKYGDKVVLDVASIGAAKPKRVTIVQRSVRFDVQAQFPTDRRRVPFGLESDPIFDRPMSTDRTAPSGEPSARPRDKEDSHTLK